MPKGFRDMKRELEENNQISPELQKMHEIFGDPNCGTAARYEDGTCSKIVYDPAKMSYSERMQKQQYRRDLLYPNEQLEAPQQPTETEIQAKRLVDFTSLINPKRRLNKY
jgi:hypothetical protein